MEHHTIACLFLAVSASLLAAQIQPGQSVGQATKAKPVVASVPAAFAQGRAEAKAEWQTNTATLYRYGLPAAEGNLDRETGLSFTAIAGCIVNDAIQQRAAGHNQRIKELIAQHGLPSYSRKRWVDDLDAPERWFARPRPQTPPTVLTVNASPATNQPCSLRLVGIPTGDPDGKLSLKLQLEVGGRRRDLAFPLGHYAARSTELLWGPPGADVAFLRWSDFEKPFFADIREVFVVLDLRNGEWLRVRIINRIN